MKAKPLKKLTIIEAAPILILCIINHLSEDENYKVSIIANYVLILAEHKEAIAQNKKKLRCGVGTAHGLNLIYGEINIFFFRFLIH